MLYFPKIVFLSSRFLFVLANMESPGEMPQNVAFQQDLYWVPR